MKIIFNQTGKYFMSPNLVGKLKLVNLDHCMKHQI